MPVSHASSSIPTSTDGQVPGLLEVLAQVVLAVAVVCVLAGAKNFREIRHTRK